MDDWYPTSVTFTIAPPPLNRAEWGASLEEETRLSQTALADVTKNSVRRQVL